METTTFLGFVTEGLTTVLGWCGTVIGSVFNSNGDMNALAPLVAIGISVSALRLGAKVIRHFVWGM